MLSSWCQRGLVARREGIGIVKVGLAQLASGAQDAARSFCAFDRGSMKHIDLRMAGALAAMVSLSACVVPPTVPMIPVAPGPNKTFEVFAAEQAFCQQYATAQTAPQAY